MIYILIAAIMGTLMPTKNGKQGNEADMIPLLKRHEIQVLLKAGFTVADVANRSATSADTVRRVRKEAAVENTDDRADRVKRRIGRSSKAAPFVGRVSAWLKSEPDLPTQELLRRAKESGVHGQRNRVLCVGRGREAAARDTDRSL